MSTSHNLTPHGDEQYVEVCVKSTARTTLRVRICCGAAGRRRSRTWCSKASMPAAGQDGTVPGVLIRPKEARTHQKI
jgi:hypothetical protein